MTTIKPSYVQFIPSVLEPGILYVSKEFGTAAHLCCCGCGSKVVTPLSAAYWSLSESEKGVSLHPSIGNWSFKCRSHYWIRNGAVKWSYRMTEEEIAWGRERDEAQRRQLYDERGREKDPDDSSKDDGNDEGLGKKIARAVRKWFR